MFDLARIKEIAGVRELSFTESNWCVICNSRMLWDVLKHPLFCPVSEGLHRFY